MFEFLYYMKVEDILNKIMLTTQKPFKNSKIVNAFFINKNFIFLKLPQNVTNYHLFNKITEQDIDFKSFRSP